MQLQSFFAARSTQLIIAVSGIYFSYIATGVIQERLFISDYSGLNRKPGTFPRFNYAFATSLFQNILSYLLAKLVNRYSKPSPTQMTLKYKVMLGGLSFGTVFLTNQSMVYVSFLVQTITKSSKVLSILLTSMLFGFKGHHTPRQYLCGLLITVGVIIFTLNQSKGVEGSSSIIGIAALLLSLLCDGLLGTIQEDVRHKYRPNKWEQMEALNKWGAIICFVVSIVTWQIGGFIHYVKEQPYVIEDLVWMTILTTLGQIFVFYTLEHFSAFVLGIITTTRRFFTVLFSIVIYHHDMNAIQWIAIVLVFAGVFLEMTGKPKPQQKKSDELQDLSREENVKLNEKVEVKVGSPLK